MADERELARKWIGHHLEAASAQAEEVGDKEIQELVEQLIRRLRELYDPLPPS
jgi:hypothetical protein